MDEKEEQRVTENEEETAREKRTEGQTDRD